MLALAARFLQWTHVAVIAFVAVGWAALPAYMLPIYLLAIPLIVLSWQLPPDGCMLTLLEQHLTKDEKLADGFSAGLLERAFGWSPDAYLRFNYIVVSLASLLGLLRLFF